MNQNELKHFLKLGEKSKEHKYYERVNVGTKAKPKYRYFYSKLAYNIYLKNQQRKNNTLSIFNKNTFTNSSSKLLNRFRTLKKTVSTPKSTTVKKKIKPTTIKKVEPKKVTAKSLAAKVSEFLVKKQDQKVSELTGDKKSSVKNFVEKGKELVKNSLSKTTKEVSKALSKGIEAAKQTLDKTVKSISANIDKGVDAVSKAIDKIDKMKPVRANEYIKPGSVIGKTPSVGAKEIAEKYPAIAKVLKRQKPPTTLEEDRELINPYYSDSYDFQTNCYSCSMSYDMRKRGFDTTALVDIYGGMMYDDIEDCYDGGEFDSFDLKDTNSSEEAIEKMKEQLLAESNGEDSFGFISCWWEQGGGHIFNYEIVNGEVTFVDTQVPNNSNHVADIKRYVDMIDYKGPCRVDDFDCNIVYMRTDNLYPNENILHTTTVKESYSDVQNKFDNGEITNSEYIKTKSDAKILDDMIYLCDRYIEYMERNDIDEMFIFDNDYYPMSIEEAKEAKERYLDMID